MQWIPEVLWESSPCRENLLHLLKKCWCQSCERDIWGCGHPIDFQSTHPSRSLLCVKLFKHCSLREVSLYPPRGMGNLPVSLSISHQVFHTDSTVLVKWALWIGLFTHGLKRSLWVPQGPAHYHHREGPYHYHHVLVNGSFQSTSSSNVLSSHNGLVPAAFLVNDHIHYSSRISVIIDFVQTVCIPQCVLNPIPERCWTLSHLIRLHESATLRQLLHLLHYTPDNWWPLLRFNQRLYTFQEWTHCQYDSMVQHVQTKQVWACSACATWNRLFSSMPAA